MMIAMVFIGNFLGADADEAIGGFGIICTGGFCCGVTDGGCGGDTIGGV
jgi:hypothetical protein